MSSEPKRVPTERGFCDPTSDQTDRGGVLFVSTPGHLQFREDEDRGLEDGGGR